MLIRVLPEENIRIWDILTRVFLKEDINIREMQIVCPRTKGI
nr:hypothetical protein Iba_chr08aCG0260 [Ipomoea batatas]GMD56061.1 hypothetical protein Iba_chr11dCG14000 [Ipomoea batatas]